MSTSEKSRGREALKKTAYAGVMAALCYVGYAVIPPIPIPGLFDITTGTKIHVGNAFVVLGSLFLGNPYGGLAGAIGLSLADILLGYSASAPRTFITKLVIGLIVALVAHKIATLSRSHKHTYIVKWAIISSVAGLGFNCIFEPFLKYIWFTLITPNADKAQSAIKALVGVTIATSFVNAIINTIVAVVIYLALRPVLYKTGLLGELKVKKFGE
ncbi:MAG: ECF transporter S component [Lachnospiraceae bacterium]|jgi:uncharacterized membrane protein|nr:ECF transporter S component [Lachnospiraceae bacterium]